MGNVENGMPVFGWFLRASRSSPRIAFVAVWIALVAACSDGDGGGGGAAIVAAAGGARQSSTVGLSGDDRTLVVVNPDSDTVTIFDVTIDPPQKLDEISVGDEPASVAVTPNGRKAYVACTLGSGVWVIDLSTRGVSTVIPVGKEPMACALSPNATRLYVANSVSGSVSVIDTTADAVVATVAIPRSIGTHPRALGVTNDGDIDDTDERVLVPMFFAELAAGRTGLDMAQDDSHEGRVAIIETFGHTLVGHVALSAMANTGFRSNGSSQNFTGTANGQGGSDAQDPSNPAQTTLNTGAYPNQLAAVAIHPISGRGYVVSTGASPNGPVALNVNAQGLCSVFDPTQMVEITAGPVSTTIHQEAPLNLNRGLKQDTATTPVLFHTSPSSIAWRPDGSEAWVVVQQADVLVRMTVDQNGIPTINAPVTAGGSSITRIDLHAVPSGSIAGKNPRGIAINRRGDRAYVMNFVSRSITVFDLDARAIIATAASDDQPAAGTIEATVQLGAELFFTGRGPEERMSGEGWGGCVVCHPGGLTDGVTWIFAAGPRQTIPLDGMFSRQDSADQRVLNWSAVRDENHDFEENTRNVFGGRGLIDDDRLMFLIGGAKGATPTEPTGLLQYHQFLNSFTTTNAAAGDAPLPALLAGRRDFGCATLEDGRVFVIGGRTGAGQGQLVGGNQSVVLFDPKTNTIVSRSSVGFTPRHSFGAHAAATAMGPRIYVIGGYAGAGAGDAPIATVEEYNPASDTWRTVAAMPTATAEFGCAMTPRLNKGEPLSRIHVLGGNLSSEATPTVTGNVFVFTPDPIGSGSWIQQAFSITPRRNLGAAAVLRGVLPNAVFAIGGRDQVGNALTTVESYVGTTSQAVPTNPTTLVLSPITQLPAARHSFAIGTADNRIYIMGGVDGAGADLSSVLEFNAGQNPAGGTPGAAGTPAGNFTTKAALPDVVRGAQVTCPTAVLNFLSRSNTGRDLRQDAINEWIKFAVRSHVAPESAATADAQAGRTHFGQPGLTGVAQVSCATCHGGAKWTRSIVDYSGPPSPDLVRGNEEVTGAELRKTSTQPGSSAANGVLVDVGTFDATKNLESRPNPADVGQRVAALGANGFNVPSLLSVHSTAPYFHNGTAQTLDDVLNGSFDGSGNGALRTVHRVTDPNVRAQLIAFLRSIDGTTPAFP